MRSAWSFYLLYRCRRIPMPSVWESWEGPILQDIQQMGPARATIQVFCLGHMQILACRFLYYPFRPSFILFKKAVRCLIIESIYSYIELPVFAKLKVPIPSSSFSIFAILGPNFSYLTGASVDTDSLNRFDVGIPLRRRSHLYNRTSI